MDRRLVVVIEANEETCGECGYLEDETCALFSCDLDTSDDSDEERVRCSECLDAETRALEDSADD